ncbi:Bgt-50799 [Blumeria graminis f. sp. tritici]|uniref:Bgt-50799 n=1 Tax=Blumeria graminis f. sp. tritici TaxID=62690 RepID=A0A9X9MJU7_BLUGR|nr:Bgt-50799 [Blumeria graminis f. sp. tritici]
MNANLVLALLSKHPHLMYIELAVVTTISHSIANLSYIPKAASLPFSYLVILAIFFRDPAYLIHSHTHALHFQSHPQSHSPIAP